jgi:hypothetical protein
MAEKVSLCSNFPINFQHFFIKNMGVVHLKTPLRLGVVVIYCLHKDEQSTEFDINPQRHHINEKNDTIH